MNTRQIGKEKEELAAKILKQKGYRILNMNFSCKMGEVDIVAKDGEYLVFCEVKYRKKSSSGLPVEAVSLAKQKKITKVAYYYILSKGYTEDTPVRFDVISVLGENVNIIKNAFEAAE